MRDYSKGVPHYDNPIAMPNVQTSEFTLEDYFRNLDRTCGDEGKAKSKQVGGSHYTRSAMQPWDIISEWELDFWRGNVLKYILRAPHKGKVEDLQKARHYLDYLIENYDTVFKNV